MLDLRPSDRSMPLRSRSDPADPLLIGRIRSGLWGVLVSSAMFASVAPWLAQAGLGAMLATLLGLMLVAGVGLRVLERAARAGTVVLLGEVVSLGVIVASLVGALTLRQRFTAPMIPVVLAMGTGSFIPWGVRPQTRIAAYATGAVLFHLFWLGPGLEGDPTLTAFLGIALSVLVAGTVARDRGRMVALAEARHEADERFRSLAARTPEVFWWLTPGGRLTFLSEAFATVWGRPIAEVLASPGVLYETVHRDDRARVERAMAGIAEHGFDEEFRIVRPDGSLRTVRSRAFVTHDGPGGAARVTGLAEDVTERRATEAALRASERRYAALVDHAPDPILTFDGRGCLLSANPATARLFGWSQVDVVGRFRFLRVVERDSRAVVRRVVRELAARGAARPAELEILRSDGERVLVEANHRLRPMVASGVEVEVILRDITERRRAEEAAQLRILNARMEIAREGGRQRLARRLHDELAQPLAALRLEMNWLGRELEGARGDAVAPARAMSELVESVIGAAQEMIADLRPSVLDDFGLAEAVRWQARSFQQKVRIECVADIEPEETRCAQECAVAAFRTLQEMLDAVAQQPGADGVQIVLRSDEGTVTMRVQLRVRELRAELAGALAPDSWQVARMRERARLLGGGLEVAADESSIALELRLHADVPQTLEANAAPIPRRRHVGAAPR